MNIGEDAGQLVVAVFDDWDTLQTVLEEMVKAKELTSSGALLHVGKDVPPPLYASGSLRSITELRFGASSMYVTCMGGGIAEQLTAASSQGESSLAHALCYWLTPVQARQLQSHIEKGHLVLLLEFQIVDDFSAVCARLVRASPHLVDLCRIKDKTPRQLEA
jgi:hypothetical protein